MFKKILLFICIGMSFTIQAETHDPQQFLKDIAGKPNEGILIVDQFCANCHAKNPTIPIGAPVIQDAKAWQPRLQKGFTTLLENTANGFNAMPARGGCFECSDDQLILAILELIPESAKNAYISNKDDHNKNSSLK